VSPDEHRPSENELPPQQPEGDNAGGTRGTDGSARGPDRPQSEDDAFTEGAADQPGQEAQPERPTSSDDGFAEQRLDQSRSEPPPERPQSRDDGFAGQRDRPDDADDPPMPKDPTLGIELGLEPTEEAAAEQQARRERKAEQAREAPDGYTPSQEEIQDAAAARAAGRQGLEALENQGYTLGGQPMDRVSDWHPQGWNDKGYEGTCGLVSVEGTARHAGTDTSESHVVDVAADKGLCETEGDPEQQGGTNPWDRQAVLDELGVPSRIESDRTPEDLAQMVERNDGVIARVNAGELWGDDDHLGAPAPDGRLRPNHAVSVTGTVRKDGALDGFVVNDSGVPDGAGKFVPLDRWNMAWTDTFGGRELNVVGAEFRR
jgi:hypothetical protein